jgi:hypothetical protein
MRTTWMILMLLICTQIVSGQQFIKSNQQTAQTKEIIIENYTALNISFEQYAPKFDSENAYTFLQVVTSQSGGLYHILIQTTFTGKMVYAALSNNLFPFFLCEKIPMTFFDGCVRQIDKSENIEMTFTEEIIDCILKRLNDCDLSK